MQAISTQALSSRTSPAGLANKAKRSSRQPSRSVVVNAAKGNEVEKQEQKGPNKMVMQAVGAIAAVQMALGGPAFAEDILPASAESASARAEVNKETSDAPSLGDIGKSLTQNLFGGGDVTSDAKQAVDSAADKAKNAAPDLSALDFLPNSAESSSARDAVNKETSDAPSLTDIGKNFQSNVLGGSGGNDVAQAGKEVADKAASKAKNAAPDLSQGIFDRAQKSIGKISQEAGGAQNQFPDALTNLGKAQSGLAKNAGAKADVATSQVSNSASNAAESAKKGASKAVGKAKNAAPDLSQLPDPAALLDQLTGKASGAADSAQGKASDVQGRAQGAASQVSGQAQSALGSASGSAQEAVGKAQNAAPDLSGLLDQITGKVSGDVDATKGKASEVQGKAQGAASQASGKAQSALGSASGSAKQAAGKAKNAAPDLSGLLDQITGKVSGDIDATKGKASEVQGKAQGAASQASGKAQSALGSASGSAKQAAGKAKNAAPDLSGLLDQITGKVSGDVDATKGKASEVQGKVQGATSQASGKAQSALGSASGSAKQAAGKAKNAAPDLSQLPDPSSLLDQITGKVSGDVDATKGKASEVQGKAQGAASQVSGQAQSALGSAAGSAQDAAGKAKNAAPDLSTADLPDGAALFKRLQGRENTWDPLARQAERAGAQAKKVGSDVAAAGSKAGAKAQNAGKTAIGKAKNAAPDLSFNPLELFTGEPQKAAEDAKKSAAELQSTGGQDFNSGGGPNPSTDEAKDISKGYKAGSKDLPVPNVGDDVETGQINN